MLKLFTQITCESLQLHCNVIYYFHIYRESSQSLAKCNVDMIENYIEYFLLLLILEQINNNVTHNVPISIIGSGLYVVESK